MSWRSTERGAISIEVLLALLPLLFTFLTVAQLSLLKMGELIVTHAAGRAVRSAVVILDDDPKYYGGAPRGDLLAGALQDEKGVLGFIGGVNNAYANIVDSSDVQGGARLDAIRQVAYYPLSVLAPPGLGASSSLGTEVGGSPWTRLALFSFAYNRAAAAVEVEGGNGLRDPVTVRVNYLMKCGVPLVSRFMCTPGTGLARASLGLSSDKRHRSVVASLASVASPLLRDTITASGGSFRLITAQATLPNQAAGYHED